MHPEVQERSREVETFHAGLVGVIVLVIFITVALPMVLIEPLMKGKLRWLGKKQVCGSPVVSSNEHLYLCASQFIPLGTKIDRSMLVYIWVPLKRQQKNAVVNYDDVEGFTSLVDVQKGSVLLSSQIK